MKMTDQNNKKLSSLIAKFEATSPRDSNKSTRSKTEPSQFLKSNVEKANSLRREKKSPTDGSPLVKWSPTDHDNDQSHQKNNNCNSETERSQSISASSKISTYINKFGNAIFNFGKPYPGNLKPSTRSTISLSPQEPNNLQFESNDAVEDNRTQSVKLILSNNLEPQNEKFKLYYPELDKPWRPHMESNDILKLVAKDTDMLEISN